MASKVNSNLYTPTKSILTQKAQFISPKKSNSKANDNVKLSSPQYRNSFLEQQSVENSLISKIIQNQILNQDEYKNLLIKNKEMQIKLLKFQQETQLLKKQYKKASKPIEQIKNKIQKSRLSLIEKHKYLDKFYVHLDSKLKTNMQSNLFNRLEKIQKALQQKYQHQRVQLYHTLTAQKKKVQQSNSQIHKLRQYRDQLIKQYTQRKIQISSHKGFSQNNSSSNKNSQNKNKSQNQSQSQSHKKKSSSESYKENKSVKGNKKQNAQKSQLQKRKELKKAARKKVEQEYNYMKQSIEKLKKQKQIAQKDQKLLKVLLNIDEEHKKYSSYIINGYKKIFSIKYRELMCKRKSLPSNQAIRTSSGTMPDIQGLQKQLNQKIAQKKVLQQEAEERSKALQMCKIKLNEQIAEYSQLQQEIMNLNNKNSSYNNRGTYQNSSKNNQQDENYNPRSTYGAFPQNNRSTYTSYQKRQYDEQEDL